MQYANAYAQNGRDHRLCVGVFSVCDRDHALLCFHNLSIDSSVGHKVSPGHSKHSN